LLFIALPFHSCNSAHKPCEHFGVPLATHLHKEIAALLLERFVSDFNQLTVGIEKTEPARLAIAERRFIDLIQQVSARLNAMMADGKVQISELPKLCFR
jgi:hypothetical protein